MSRRSSRSDAGTCTDKFISKVEVDRQLIIVVGASEQTQMFRVAENLFTMSSKVFEAAVRNEGKLGMREKGTFRYPEDDSAAWRVIVSIAHV